MGDVTFMKSVGWFSLRNIENSRGMKPFREQRYDPNSAQQENLFMNPQAGPGKVQGTLHLEGEINCWRQSQHIIVSQCISSSSYSF